MTLPDLLAIGDIRREDHHLDAAPPQALHRGLRRRRGAAAADQGQMTCAAACEVVGDRQSEASETAGDQVAGVGIDRDGLSELALDLEPLRDPAWR